MLICDFTAVLLSAFDGYIRGLISPLSRGNTALVMRKNFFDS